MKRLLLMLVTTAMVFFAGCGLDIDEALGTLESQVEDLEDRVSALERQCKKMNENILSLQTIVDGLQEGMTVSSVKTITDSNGTEVGYTITFSNSTTITIHNGADGKDGADGEDGTDGKDGYVPTIGVKQHTDSYYYWTIDGEWLLDDNGQKLRAVGVDGADGENGEDGKDGSDGSNGANGADGVTPQLEIRDGYWWVSYNGGTSWQQLGKATGDDGADGKDGSDGEDGKDGADSSDLTSIFKSVTYDEEFVYFTLSDGTIITIPLVIPEVVEWGVVVQEVDYDGITLNITVPESVKEEDHLIKWAAADLYLYNRYKLAYTQPDTDLMNDNDSEAGWKHMYFNSSTTLHLTEMNSYARNEDGSINTKYHYYEALVPGQPEVVIFGEYEPGQHWGWDWGYYEPLFDRAAWSSALAKNGGEFIDEAPYWTGAYHKEIVVAKKPEKLDDSLMSVELDIQTDDAIIDVTVDDSIEAVCVMVLDEEQHALAYKWLGESYEHFQWFATSYVAMMEGVTGLYSRSGVNGIDENGRLRTILSQYLNNVSMTSKYWVYVVGLSGYDEEGNMNGSKQVCWNMNGFNLKPLTKPAPTVEVTPVEPLEPNKAYYKIFCPSAAEGNGVTKGYYISNYEKDWLSSGMTAQELLDAYAWGNEIVQFSQNDLNMINSADGLIIDFDSRPNENFYFAAVFTNDEGSRTYSDAVVCRTYETPVDRVESEYFESLKGDWTASATVRYKAPNEDDMYEEHTKTHTCTITVGDAEYPEYLNESVYETYEKHGVSREKTDLYFSEFCKAVDLFNETNRAQNRILVNGFNFAGEMLEYLPYFNFQSAYDLFISDTYNGVSHTMPVYDFGPKWFFEVMADGSLAVPFNTVYYAPMGSWYTDPLYGEQEIHLIAYEPTTSIAMGYVGTGGNNGVAETGYFPVEISEDGNTITIRPYEYPESPGYKFYPNVGVYNPSDPTSYGMSIYIISEITLTRGAAAEPARVAAKGSKAVAPVEMKVEAKNGIKTATRSKHRTLFGATNKVKR